MGFEADTRVATPVRFGRSLAAKERDGVVKKIHFVNRIDRDNIGDVACCPLSYYSEYFLQYNVLRHDLDYIDWGVVERGDIVILGGGGVLNVTPSFNIAINKLLDRCDTVIGWSVGHNTHNHRWGRSEDFEGIDYARFALIAIRDFNHPSGLEWLPCPSGLAPELATRAATKRRFGYIAHKDLAPAFASAEHIDNSFNLADIADYMAGSETVVTYSYHMAYWAQLMGRAVVVVDKFSDKFDYFKYPIAFVETGPDGLTQEALETAQPQRAPEGARAEAVALNDRFFARVREIVEAKGFRPGNAFQAVYQLTFPKAWNTQNEFQRLRRDQAGLALRLDEEDKRLRADLRETHRSVHQRIDREGEILHNRITEREAEILRRAEEGRQAMALRIERMLGQIAAMQQRIEALEARTPAPQSDTDAA